MNKIADGSVIIQSSSELCPSTPSWLGARRADGCASHLDASHLLPFFPLYLSTSAPSNAQGAPL
jgi:hypothetical protein